jgi:hypothetical protein
MALHDGVHRALGYGSQGRRSQNDGAWDHRSPREKYTASR